MKNYLAILHLLFLSSNDLPVQSHRDTDWQLCYPGFSNENFIILGPKPVAVCINTIPVYYNDSDVSGSRADIYIDWDIKIDVIGN